MMKPMMQWVKAAWWRGSAILVCALTMFTACSDNDENPVTPDTPDTPEMADYAILFYGYGGTNLDHEILMNIEQFYTADNASYSKVKIAVQYKFSSQNDFQELLNYDPESYDDPKEKAEIEEYLAEMKPWVEKWKNRCNFTFRFTVDPKKTVAQQMVADNVYGGINDHIANADSLISFINWAAKTCPAKHYVLLLSDHGAGYTPHDELPYTPANATRSFLIDSSKSDKLTMNSLKYAIDKASIKPQVIYFDACLMNCMEYLFELKDRTDYIVASAFLVPGWGGDYKVLTNLLANCNEDTESALQDYTKACVEQWDKNYGDEKVESFFDMTVIRTRGLDAFGQEVRMFTDKLLQAYQSSDEVRQRIDSITANSVMKVYRDEPLYDLLIYSLLLAAKAPELETPFFEMKACYDKDCIVAHQTCAYLRAQGITGSVLLGWEGQYEEMDWRLGKDGWVLYASYVFKPDGTVLEYQDDEVKEQAQWNSTFADTYEQTAFDKATGWSRWIKANKQRPAKMSVFTEGYTPNEPKRSP